MTARLQLVRSPGMAVSDEPARGELVASTQATAPPIVNGKMWDGRNGLYRDCRMLVEQLRSRR